MKSATISTGNFKQINWKNEMLYELYRAICVHRNLLQNN